MTLIARAWEVVAEIIADRLLPMLAHLRCVSDKASGETKHKSMFFVFVDVLVGGSPQILTGTLCQGRVGHTHTRPIIPRVCYHGPRLAAECGLTGPGRFS